MRVDVIVPALNEAGSIAAVVAGMLANGASRVIVVDNGSTDDTAQVAAKAGATVVREDKRGYGRACLAGIAACQDADVIVIADGDGCDDPADLPRILEPILTNQAEMCLGSRMTGDAEPGAIPFHSRFGNWLGAACLRLLFRQNVTDMGPFRAIRADALRSMNMSDPNFGWNVEMQTKAALAGMRVSEVPARYRTRKTGESKITGNLTKSLEAGAVILGTIFRVWIRSRAGQTRHAELDSASSERSGNPETR